MSVPPARADAGAEDSILSATHVLEYDYRRSVGPVLGRFFTGLRDHRIVANRTREGRVLCPPAEYDPASGEPTRDEFVEVGPGGVVTSWAWVASPRARHPLDRPFAFALVRLDGADTALLHAVDAGSEERMSAGMRVTARFAEPTRGSIHDIACFVPEEGS
jgi:uncharacterized OB-fold protein